MNKRLLCGLAFSAALSAASAFADDAKVTVDTGASVSGDATETSETKIKHKKNKTTIKTTKHHSGDMDTPEVRVKAHADSDHDDDEGATAEAKAKVKTDD